MNNSICNKALSKGAGFLSSLEKELTSQEVRKLELLGYIENAITPEGETWKLTSKGKKTRKLLMEKRTWIERIKNEVYTRILKFNVTL